MSDTTVEREEVPTSGKGPAAAATTEDETQMYVNAVLENWKTGSVFISGPGGTGKSYLVAAVIDELVKEGVSLDVTASSGVAAFEMSQKLRMKNGKTKVKVRTLNAWAKVGLGINPAGLSEAEIEEAMQKVLSKIRGQFSRNPTWFDHITDCDFLVIEEVSMISCYLLDLVDRVCQSIRKSKAPFGGIKVAFVGDFLQLPPVVKSKGREETVKPWAFKARSWEAANPTNILLSEPKRYPDLRWFKLLKRIRKGNSSPSDKKFLKDIQKMGIPEFAEGTVRPTYLFSRRDTVDEGNMKEIRKLPAKSVKYHHVDHFYDRKGREMAPSKDTEIKQSQLEDIAPEDVVMKVGAQVMLLRNMSVENNLVNGRRGIVMETNEETVTVLFEGDTVATSIGYFEHSVEDDFGKASRMQIPLALAWYMTIHKSQGCTFSSAVISLGNDIFEDAQAYVALSRVRTSEGLYITDYSSSSLRANQEAVEFYERIG